MTRASGLKAAAVEVMDDDVVFAKGDKAPLRPRFLSVSMDVCIIYFREQK